MRRFYALLTDSDVSSSCLALTLLAVYAVSRALLLDTELTFEEPIWVNQGITFFETGRFTSYLSLELPDYSGFHKPPLLSILLATAHEFFGASNTAYRIVPFALGLASFLIAMACVRRLGGSLSAFRLLIIFTPFLLVGTNQIQIDGSVGIFGYVLLLYACLRGLKDDGPFVLALIFVAGLWLALAKTEIFVFGGIGLAIAAGFAGGRQRLARHAGVYAVSFLPAALVIGFMSMRTFGSLRGFAEIYRSMIGIVRWQMLQKLHVEEGSANLAPSSLKVWQQVTEWDIHVILFFGLAAIVATLLLGARSGNGARHQAATLAGFILPPVSAYIGLGWVGDSFPRYFLIVVPICLVAFSSAPIWAPWTRVAPLAAVVYALAMAPQMGEIYRSDVSWTSYRGEGGFEQAGLLLKHDLPKDTIILSPRPVAFYYGGPFYDIWWSQPRKWNAMMREDNEKLGAWAYFADDAELTPRDVQQRDLYALLERKCRIERVVPVGTLRVAFLSEPRC